MTRRVIGPFNRVEGDLEVKIDIHDGRVTDAWVTSPLYRGFEHMLAGKDPRDALIYSPRICGICSVSQSVAAAMALREAQGITMMANGELATNLVLACENVVDHLTHFYLFFMPDFARQVYAKQLWFGEVSRRFKAVEGSACRQFLSARAQFLHLMGILAGKWPHSLALQPGGTTCAVGAAEKQRLLSLLFAWRQFLESQLFGVTLEQIGAMQDWEELHDYSQADSPGGIADMCRFLFLAQTLKLHQLGRATDRFMSYGAYEMGGRHRFKQGVWQGRVEPLDSSTIGEDVSHSWLDGTRTSLHPKNGITQACGGKEADGYTWCKAPRLDGRVVEVGAIARQLIDGQPLVEKLVQENGGNVRNRVVARLLEVARIVPMMEQWVKALQPGEPFCLTSAVPEEGEGAGMVEAARGSLGHWLSVRNGRIYNYQIVAPTTWNFSPRDGNGQPGALEQALIGAPVLAGENEPVAVQHIVRSFDPCMVCTVH